MENILSKKHYRGIFYTFVILFLALSLILRYFVLPSYDSTIDTDFTKLFAALLDGFTISLILTVFMGSFVFWLTPEIVKKSVIDILEPKEIGPLLKKATTDTKLWIYKGACGRYTRATTLPTIAKAARHEGIGRDIRISVINPDNDVLCAEYATYRRSLKSASAKNIWTESKVKEEVLATIISALRYKHEEPLLRIEIHLVNYFSAFRFDISDDYVIVTKEDKEASGLKADKGTYFYDSYVDDVRLSERQSKRVSFNDFVPGYDELTDENIKAIITDAGLLSENKIDNIDISNILRSVNTPEDPYS